MLDRNGYKERVFQGVEDGDWRGYRSYGDSSNMRISGTSSHQGRNEETKREDRYVRLSVLTSVLSYGFGLLVQQVKTDNRTLAFRLNFCFHIRFLLLS